MSPLDVAGGDTDIINLQGPRAKLMKLTTKSLTKLKIFDELTLASFELPRELSKNW